MAYLILQKDMRLTLITGFLGSGKTTLVQQLLKTEIPGFSTGIIVNDLSELDVDGDLIRMGHRVSEENGTLISLADGSISDRKQDAFSAALASMHKRGMNHVIIETSGGSHPGPVIETLMAAQNATLGAVVTLIDARAMVYDYECGPQLLRVLVANEESGEKTAENLLADQIRYASIIALTKIDLVKERDLELVLLTLQVLNPSARIMASVYGKLDLNILLTAENYIRSDEQSDETASSNRLITTDFGIQSAVLRDARPFHPRRLFNLYRNNLRAGVFRSKGFMWMASRSDDILLWNQSGGTLSLGHLGFWKASVLKDEKLLPEERAGVAEAMLRKHPDFGDRHNEITVIGSQHDREAFMQELTQCLCTEEEIDAWKQGQHFADPWPTRYAEL